ncbi:MAG: 16S rRNA (cytidine1402-2'-O)-methyltransferase [Sphingobacteriales bacterium]|jgi:16S rRNA (cytidine1402-2'-O)-methyltransferase
MQTGILYLIPSLLSPDNLENQWVIGTPELVQKIKFYAVEEIKTARRFLKKLHKPIDIDELTFINCDKKASTEDISKSINLLKNGNDVALISEAGCPSVADPGGKLVAAAHENNIKVCPIVGPSSIILALMASGLNGQNFSFVGYIPINKQERIKRIKELEARSVRDRQTQIFIETPYRNNPLMQDLVKSLSGNTKLCVAKNITGEDEFISTKSVKNWKNQVPELHKIPTIFLFQA